MACNANNGDVGYDEQVKMNRFCVGACGTCGMYEMMMMMDRRGDGEPDRWRGKPGNVFR